LAFHSSAAFLAAASLASFSCSSFLLMATCGCRSRKGSLELQGQGSVQFGQDQNHIKCKHLVLLAHGHLHRQNQDGVVELQGQGSVQLGWQNHSQVQEALFVGDSCPNEAPSCSWPRAQTEPSARVMFVKA
jgi:hypothetical protein